MRLPRWLSGKESACQCRRHRRCRFNPWVRKIPWSRKWQLIPVSILAWKISWTEEPGGLQSTGLQRVGCDTDLIPGRGWSHRPGRVGFSGYGTRAQQSQLVGSQVLAPQLWCMAYVSPYHVGANPCPLAGRQIQSLGHQGNLPLPSCLLLLMKTQMFLTPLCHLLLL